MTYEENINSLIPRAERHANENCKREDHATKLEFGQSWDRSYFGEMDRLAHEHGYRAARGQKLGPAILAGC